MGRSSSNKGGIMKKLTQVYLCGAVAPDPRCFEWRTKASAMLSHHFTVTDPSLNAADRSWRTGKTDIDTLITHTQGMFLFKDYAHIKETDIIFVNLTVRDPDRPMVGTLFEIAWGFHWKKCCIMIVDNSHYSKHPFIAYTASAMFTDTVRACTFIRGAYL